MICGIHLVQTSRTQEICHRTWKNILKNNSWKENHRMLCRQKSNACHFLVIIFITSRRQESSNTIFEIGPFLPCQDLFDWWTLRCGVWVVFLLAMLGNGTVVFVLIFARSKIDVPRFLVCNLAAADFFMGLYLGIV